MKGKHQVSRRRRGLFGLSVALSWTLGVAVYGSSSNNSQLSLNNKVPLPTASVVDSQSVPLLASDKKAGFISSVTDGSVISFSTTSGKVLSSVVVGESAARLAMLELPDRRLIAAPTVNAPDRGRPATISIIDATNPRRLDPILLLVLPETENITPSTQAYFTVDGKFVLIATQFIDPAVLCYSTETGQLVSQAPLIGAPSQMALYQPEAGAPGFVAVASLAANTLTLLSVDQSGALAATGSFTPAGTAFDEVNNPVFSTDGQKVFIASSPGQQLYAVDSASGALMSTAPVAPSPEKVALASSGSGDVLAVTCVPPAASTKPGGVAILGWDGVQLTPKSEFNPPAPIEFSKANNVALSDDGSIAFVASKNGVLFAFGTASGEMQSHQEAGADLLGVGLSQQQQVIAAIHRTTGGDEIVIASFDVSDEAGESTDSDKSDEKSKSEIPKRAVSDAAPAGPATDAKKQKLPPVITRIVPDTVVVGRSKRLTVVAHGEHFKTGSDVFYNGIKAATTALSNSALQFELPKDLFAQTGTIAIQVRDSIGISQPVNLEVLPSTPPPSITRIVPDSVSEGRNELSLVVHGQQFSPGAVVVYNNTQTAVTTPIKATALRAKLPKALFAQAGAISIQVKNKNDSLSQPVNLAVMSTDTPIIKSVSPQKLEGPHPAFEVKVKGSNFRANSVIQVQTKLLKTTFVSDSILTATVPLTLSKTVGTLNVQVIDNKGKGNSSNVETITLLGPQITALNVIKNPLLAGTGHFRMEVKGRNFREGARVLVNGSAVKISDVKRISAEKLRVEVPGNLNQDAGSVPVVVRNPDKAESAPVTFNAAAPEITAVNPTQLIAGESNVGLEILGQNFRGKATIAIGQNGATPVEIDTKFVRFVSKHKVVVKLRGKLNELISQPGTLSIQVVNPNKTTGVPSAVQTVTVAAPQITAASIKAEKAAPGADQITITGNSFREGAVVDFLQNGQVVLERAPDVTKPDRLEVSIKKGKITALGQFQVEVINPGKIPSNAVTPTGP